ncbi:MAG: NF038122 family metalloprotease, partial [Cyanobacteria bacterium J06632_22]
MVQFNFTYDPGISLEQRTGFELAARIWGAYLTDDITVNLHIVSTDSLEGNAIGGAVPLFHEQNYGVLNEYLEQDVTPSGDPNAPSTDEQVANALQDGNTVDVLIDGEVVDGNSTVLLTSAQAKALGMDQGITLDNGTTWNRDLVDANALDGYIVINQSYDWNYDFLRTSSPEGRTLDFLSLALHEIGHQLGFVSGLDGLLDVNQLYSSQTQVDGFTLLDLFRHTADSQAISNPDGAVVDLTTGSDAMFSVNGGANGLALFSTGQGGDGFQAAHWKRMRQALGVMDPTLAYRERLNITELDAQAMDALGYDVNYSLFENGLDFSALLLEAEIAVAEQLGLDGSVLAAARSDGYPDGEYQLNFAQWWQIFEAQILELGYGSWWQILELGYGLWFQEFDAGLLELGYGAWFQEFETTLLELGYGAWFQEFETTLLELGYGNWWQLLELGYGNWWQQLETFFSTLDTVGDTNGEAIIELTGLHGNNSQAVYTGSNQDDIIGGTQVQDRVAGGNGDDLIDGAEGDDIIWGDAGRDVLYGYHGNDVLSGGKGDDLVLGEAGDDQLMGGRGADILSGGDGNDILRGGNGRDELKGGSGSDVLAGGKGDDWAQGGDQDDLIMGNEGQDKLEGGSGNDVIYGDRNLAEEQSQLAVLLQQFLANRQAAETNASASSSSIAATPSSNGFIRLEAETMQGTNYYQGDFGNASGGKILQQWGDPSATATANFDGPSGRYMVIVRYLDEANGQATAAIKINNTEIDRWQFDQDDLRFNSRTIATSIELNTGDSIELLGIRDGNENAKIDYIDFVPLDALLPTYVEGNGDAGAAEPETTTAPAATSLINNGNFESGSTSWTLGARPPALVTDTSRASTVMSLTAHDTHVYQWFNVTAGNLYEASTFAKTSSNGWGGFSVNFFDVNWQLIESRSVEAVGNTWNQYQQKVVAPEEAFYGTLSFTKNGNQGYLRVDDVIVRDLGQLSGANTSV